MPKNKKTKKTILIIVIGFAIFAALVIFSFNHVQKNPTDTAAMTYLWEHSEEFSEYGEIESISRNVIEEVKKSKNEKDVPYTIETSTHTVRVYVHLKQDDSNWVATDYEVFEVIPNTNDDTTA